MKQIKSVRQWIEQDPAGVLETVKVIGGDGWTIFDPQAFPKMPDTIKALYEHSHASGDRIKEQITRSDGSTGDVTGIYGLDVIEGVADALDCDSSKQGRGSRARDLVSKIENKLGGVA